MRWALLLALAGFTANLVGFTRGPPRVTGEPARRCWLHKPPHRPPVHMPRRQGH